MSSVRMCDTCARIFSEREDGWTTLQGTRMVRDEQTGRMTQRTETMDQCGLCSPSMTPKMPRIAVAGVAEVERLSRAQTQADRDQAFGMAVPPERASRTRYTNPDGPDGSNEPNF